jgi:hypothetical protein
MNEPIQGQTETPPQPPTAAQIDAGLRMRSKWLCLYGICARRACRRARKCRGRPQECLRRYAPLVPQEVHDGMMAMLEGRKLGLTFNQARERWPDETDALLEWTQLIEDSYVDGAEE